MKEPQRKTLFPPCLQTNRIGINTVPGTAASSGTEFMFGENIYPWISQQFTKKCPSKKSTFFFFFFFFLLLLFLFLTHSSLYLFTITKPQKKKKIKANSLQFSTIPKKYNNQTLKKFKIFQKNEKPQSLLTNYQLLLPLQLVVNRTQSSEMKLYEQTNKQKNP